ncbi:hypothetical protein LJY25_05955 [Hymenobacter sp. BT175]|uniref:hypothetical protein n=1 Tax=Hymenobacter translucens TaxID=2886507 RepID=UPI001D0EF0E2|nr:hypothetical protein [Hymenobacter translucens]MCC2545981.1 hypothetical protein [Hymenobacter translucens]
MSARISFPRLLRLLSLTGLLITASLEAQAQKYRTAIGLRLGGKSYSGLTVQQRIGEKSTLEGLAMFNTEEVSGTLLAERHFGIFGRSLNVYTGAGAHLGAHNKTGAFGGVDGLVGLEYKVAIIPLLLSFDFKPTIEINAPERMRFPTAFSIRYVLIKEKKRGLFGGSDRDTKADKRKNRD